MMIKRMALAGAAGAMVAVTLAPGAALAETGTAPAMTPAAIDEYVSRYVNETGLPGVAVAVVRDGRVLHAAGYGRDAEGAPMTASSPVSLASLSKSFTAAAVLRLADDGRIRLDEPVAAQVPEFRMADGRAGRITVRQLLNQRSGISDTTVDIPAVTGSGSLPEAVAALRNGRLRADPGTRYEYSNPNYVLAARLVEVASGEPFPVYLDRAILQPLGMTGTAATGDLPRGHIDVFGVWVPRAELDAFGLGAGRMVSNAGDMGRWLATQQDGAGVLSPAARTAMHTPPEGGEYGMGWARRTENGKLRIDHGGNLFTATGSMTLVPGSGYGFAVLSNSAGITDDAYPIVDGLIALSEGRSPGEPGAVLPIVDAVLAALTGLAAVLGVLGFRRSRRWAQKRAGAPRWRAGLRIAGVLVPVALLAGYIPMIEFLMGGRTVTLGQVAYASPALLVLLSVAAAAGLVTAMIRIVRLRVALP
ncbi:serine hydrolase domain-containing protein [Longispora albida]|uniref:serine hydrolase domain-containing protein n=1 Tax=Longispora albida TaxID=203523 RepID=UPI000365B456|nr:serine hydrolase domain-containing protein [Longispora albida]